MSSLNKGKFKFAIEYSQYCTLEDSLSSENFSSFELCESDLSDPDTPNIFTVFLDNACSLIICIYRNKIMLGYLHKCNKSISILLFNSLKLGKKWLGLRQNLIRNQPEN